MKQMRRACRIARFSTDPLSGGVERSSESIFENALPSTERIDQGLPGEVNENAERRSPRVRIGSRKLPSVGFAAGRSAEHLLMFPLLRGR